MKTMIDLLLIAAIWVFILDISGAWEELTSRISRWLTSGKINKPFRLKPLSCSLCMTFWSGLLYIALKECFTIPMAAYVCLLAFLTPRIKDMLLVLDALLAKAARWIIEKV